MATAYGPRIVDEGLILYLDASNPKSYPGTGSVWYDLSGNGHNGTMYGTGSIATVGETLAFNCASDGDYVTGSLSTSPSTNGTLEAWYYPYTDEISTSNPRGTILRLSNSNAQYLSWNKTTEKQSAYWYGKSPAGYHDLGSTVNREEWNHFISSWDNDNTTLNQFTNGVKNSVTTSGTSSINNNYNIGRENADRQLSGGVTLIRVYTIAFTDTQAYSHYEYFRKKFGK